MNRKSKESNENRRSPRSLVINRIEKVSNEAFRQYFPEITELIGHSPGIYALYDDTDLYYVGKSTELRKRVKHHLRDRHLASWTHFSLYLVRRAEHIGEIESLLVRIANPKGKSSGPLLRQLKALVKQKQREEFIELFEGGRAKQRISERQQSLHQKRLKGLVSKRAKLYKTYNGKEYTATLTPSGTIIVVRSLWMGISTLALLLPPRLYSSGRLMAGLFGFIKDLNGDWVKLKQYTE